MDVELLKMCELLAANRDILYPMMKWETSSNNVAIMGSFLYTANGMTADSDKYAGCKRILKENAGLFSEFRGNAQAMVITKMALSDDPEKYLTGALTVYRKLRELHKWTASPYMVMAALTIYEHGGTENADANIEVLEALYRREKAEHPFLTSDSDRGFFAMISMLCDNTDEVCNEIERCYQAASKLSIDKDAVHSMAQMLSFSDKPAEEKVGKVIDIYDKLKSIGCPVRKSEGLSTLGALALLDIETETLADEIRQVSDFLKDKKGFKGLSCDSKTRAMYAALLVFMYYSGSIGKAITGSISSQIAMTVAQEITMAIVICCISSSVAVNASMGSH